MTLKNRLIVLTTLAVAWTTTGFAKDTPKSASKSKDMTITKPLDGKIEWTGFGVGKSHTGEIKVKSGQVELKNEHLLAGKVVFDMSTLNSSDSQKLVGHLKSPDFFNIEKYPESTFTITKVEPTTTEGATHKIYGNLTIKDKTQAIEALAQIKQDKGQWSAQGSFEIPDRTQYDIVYNSKKFSSLSKLGDKMIEDHIKVKFDFVTK